MFLSPKVAFCSWDPLTLSLSTQAVITHISAKVPPWCCLEFYVFKFHVHLFKRAHLPVAYVGDFPHLHPSRCQWGYHAWFVYSYIMIYFYRRVILCASELAGLYCIIQCCVPFSLRLFGAATASGNSKLNVSLSWKCQRPLPVAGSMVIVQCVQHLSLSKKEHLDCYKRQSL